VADGTSPRQASREAIMRVFISWSGDLSKQLAQALRDWLESTLQYVKPFFTPDDVEKGTRWVTEISNELEVTNVCIIALTRESLDSKWIMFETGAISRSVDKGRICPILFDIEPTDVQGPLQPFQATKFSKEEIRRLLTTINSNAGEQALRQEVLERVFIKGWPDLQAEVKKILETAPVKSSEVREDRSLIEETLALVRNISNEQKELRDAVSYLARVVAAIEPTNTAIVRALMAPSLSTEGPSIGRPPLSTGPTGYSGGVAGPSALSPGFAGPAALAPGGGPGFSSISPSEGKK
jgi:TIR domain